MTNMRLNVRTPQGEELGRHMARLCDAELAGKPDNRCGTCAFRRGDHLANGSVATLMSALKATAERTPFWCHEHDVPCAGWLAMRFPAGGEIALPWDHPQDGDEATPKPSGSVICLPDLSAALPTDFPG